MKQSRNQINNEINRNEYILGLINRYIELADSKISTYFSATSALFAILSFLINILNQSTKEVCLCKVCRTVVILANILSVISLLCFIASITISYISISPKFNSNNRKEEYSIFYGEIATFNSSNKYIEASKEITDGDYNKELLNEIFYNSKICNQKMKKFKIGLWLGYSSIIVSIVSILLRISVH